MKTVKLDDAICAVCDGGPGNSCACTCGLDVREQVTVPLTGELVEDVFDETMFVKHQTESTLYHELVRAHERMGGTLFKDAADTIRAQRKQIFALEGRDAVEATAPTPSAGSMPLEYLNEHTDEWCALRIEDIKAVFNERKYILRDAAPPANAPVASVLSDVELTALIRKVEDKLGIVWFVPDDSERYAWRTTNTDERLKYARALLAASMGGEKS